MPRRPSEASEFQAKIALDQEIVRGKIPSPLLRQMGARPGDYTTFSLAETGEAIMRLSRSRRASKSAKAGRGRASKRRLAAKQ
jgi:uncharacterized protein (DUF2249 family)